MQVENNVWCTKSMYAELEIEMVYHAQEEPGFLRGTSSRVSEAETIRFSFLCFSSSFSCARVFPSFRITCSLESGCSLIPYLPRPLGSRRLITLGPLDTQACAMTMSAPYKHGEHRGHAQITSFVSSRPFADAWSFATTSMLLIRLLARFSLNII